MAVTTHKTLRNQVIYCVYVRNYSEEGSFRAVEEDLDRIKGLGTDIIWFLPIYPIGTEKRKGTLGSPYAIEDYRKINPELGSMEEFCHLADAIHAKGMKCMLDIVYNHTSPDSWLAKNHPDYFYKTPEGNMGNRVGDWSDIVDLDYNNKELWNYQIDTLKQWAQYVDGFRCDVAPLVPLPFWQKAREEIARQKPDFIWLSESVDPEFILYMRAEGIGVSSDSEIYQAFDISYDYDIHRLFQKYLEGKCSLSRYVEAITTQEYLYPENYVKLRFLENHDQPRAAKLIKDPAALMNWTAFLYFQKGTTLIYAGQENQNTNCPSLFEKDVINLDGEKDISDFLSNLYQMKKLPLLANSSYRLTADDALGAVVGVHKAVGHTDSLVGEHITGPSTSPASPQATTNATQLVGIFSFEGKPGKIQVPLKNGTYENLAQKQKTVTVADGLVDLNCCPVIIKI